MGMAQSRHSERKRVLMRAMIIDPNGTHQATIRNLSAAGAQLSSTKTPRADCDVLFKRGAIFAAARVVWASGKNYGIEFYRVIDAANLPPAAPEDCSG